MSPYAVRQGAIGPRTSASSCQARRGRPKPSKEPGLIPAVHAFSRPSRAVYSSAGVDRDPGRVHVATAANMVEVTEVGHLPHGQERAIYRDAGTASPERVATGRVGGNAVG